MEKYNAKLLILDPMSSYIGDTCSMNNANETRAEFNHLIAVAKDTGCAIVIIAYIANWMEHSIGGFLSYVGIFVAIFFAVWFAQYLIWKGKIKKINELINKEGRKE